MASPLLFQGWRSEAGADRALAGAWCSSVAGVSPASALTTAFGRKAITPTLGRMMTALDEQVASDTTAFRLIERLASDPAALEALHAVRATARARACELGARSERIVIDVDATLMGAHTEKEGAAVNFTRRLSAFTRAGVRRCSREALAGMLRSGNAPAHSAADQIAVLEQGLEQPPREVVADLDTEIVLRADAAGSALALCQAARDTRDRLRRPASRSSGRPLTPRNCSEGRRPPS